MARADCAMCGGSGWKVVERTTDGARPLEAADASPRNLSTSETTSDDKRKTVWAVPCDCTSSDRTDRVLARARVPERYRHCDFANFDTDLQYEDAEKEWATCLKQAKIVAQRFAEEYLPPTGSGSDQDHGLLLMGTCGVGKTHLAVAALKQIVLKGFSGVFYDYRELLKEIQDSYNAESQSTELTVLEPVLNGDVLLLDDLGAGKPSDWVRETVGHILNSRYNAKRATIMTTNYLDSELADRIRARPSPRLVFPSGETARPFDKEALSDRMGVRVRSRLYEMCRTVEIVAPDYRKEIRNLSRFRA